MSEKKHLIIFILSLLLAAAFIVFGIYRGEMEVVFRKAVMICLLHNLRSAECIRCGKCVAECPTDALTLSFGAKKTKCPSDDTPLN